MDVELQILKHLARDAHPTVAIAKRCCEAQIVDEYCAEYKDLFKEVRNYECFKYLHMGIISTIKRKSLPDHPQWNYESGWKNTLNNLRLIIQPLLLFWLIYPWLSIFPNSQLLRGFNHLIAAMNQFKPSYASG